MNIHRSRWMMYVGLMLVLFAAAMLQAQSFEATVVGTVKDPNGLVIPGATVTITEDATGKAQSAVTNDEGAFTLLQLKPAPYTLVVVANGFKEYTQKGLVLETNQTVRLTVNLQVGAKGERVEVTAETPTISLDTSKKGETIVNRQVENLPLNGRDFQDLAQLVPGVYPKPSDEDQGGGLSSSGTRTDATNFTLDGVANRSDRNGSVGVNTSLDSIQEFNVSTSSYSAEYGKLGGAQITVVSKSGTNELHGSAFNYLRSDLIDAQNFMGGSSKLRRNQFGGTMGGPVIKNHTFFFGSYEGYRSAWSETASVNAPNADWMGRGASGIVGDFRNLLSLTPDQCLKMYGQGKVLPDGTVVSTPHSCHVGYNVGSGTSSFREFPTPNVIPASMISPVALAILPYLPSANDGSLEGYNADALHDRNRNSFLGKIDQRIGSTNNLSARWARQSGTEYDPFPSSKNYYPHMGSFGRSRYDSIAVADTHTITMNIVNDFRFGLFDQSNLTRAQNQDQNYAAQFGIPGVTSDPYYYGFPQIRIDGYAEIGDRYNYPFPYRIKNYQFADTVTWAHGKHTFKFGADITKSNYNEGGATYMRGDFRFRGRDSSYGAVTTPNAWAFADFLMGLPDATERETVTVPTDLTGWPLGFFAQDDWKITPSLTLNIGLRYDVFVPFTEAEDRLGNFDLKSGQVILSGDPSLPRALVYTNWRNIQPRLGFAWRPFADNKTVIRGGGGLIYSQEMYNVARQQLAQNPPFQKWETYSRLSSAPTLLSFSNPWPTELLKSPPLYGMDPHGRTPQIMQFNFTLEQELAADLTWEIGYVGSLSHFLGRRYDVNQGMNPTWNCSTSTDPATNQPTVSCKPLYSSYPYPGYVSATGSAQSLTYQTQDANSNYHALQTSIRRRARKGLTMLASYTFSKTIDTTASTNNSTQGSQKYPQNTYDIAAERALSDLNHKHQFTATFVYDLPMGRGQWLFKDAKGFGNALAGGWQVNMKGSYLSGRPFTPQYQSADFTSERPDLVGDPYVAGPVAANPNCIAPTTLDYISGGQAFNPCAFARPSDLAEAVYNWNQLNPTNLQPFPAVYGNVGRNFLTGPGFFNMDLSLIKNIKLNRLREGTKMQIRFEGFNVFNHPNFQIPVYLLDQPNVGEYKTMSGDNRVFQFAVKINF